MASEGATKNSGARGEFAPVTPGEMLKEEFLAEYGLSQNQLAKAIGVSPNRIAEGWYPLRSRDVNMLGWRTRHPIPKAGSTTRAP